MTRYEALRFAIETIVLCAATTATPMVLDAIEELAYEMHLCRPADSGESK